MLKWEHLIDGKAGNTRPRIKIKGAPRIISAGDALFSGGGEGRL